jgi:putative ABC transport system permease protein
VRRILRYFRARQFERDLSAEIDSHLDEKSDELISQGIPPDEARVLAVRHFGNRTQLFEKCHDKWAFVSFDEMGQDLRYAVRLLRRSPAFAAIAVLTLALGIGLNILIFSAVDNVLLHSLPYPESDRLFAVWSRSASHGAEPMHVSAADFYDWQMQSRALQSLAAYANWPMNLTNVDEPRRLQTQLVSANLFSTLGVHAEIGRTFLPNEDQEQSAPVILISHRLWREIGEPRQVVGTQLTLNGSQATVVGVMPADFAFPSRETDAWVPLSLDAKNRSNREGRWLSVIGRLARDATPRNAETDMNVICGQLAGAYPPTNFGWSASLVPLHEELVGKTRPILLTLQTGGLLLLLITCVNLANLLLAKGISRIHEIAVRAAIGAGRARILRQLVTESMLLATLGGVGGLGLAAFGFPLVRALGDGLIPRVNEIHLSAPVAIFAVAATVVTALIFGLAPAIYISRVDLRTQISSGARETSHSYKHKGGLLVAIEVGLACVLLVGTGLLGKSLVRLLSTSSGLRTDHVLMVQLTLSRSKYPTDPMQIAFFQQILERVQRLPGTVAVGEISDTPLKGNNPTFEFVLEGQTSSLSDAPIQAGLRVISTGYLQTAGIPVHNGRDFMADDRPNNPPVAIINETMAHRYWPGANPLGRTIRLKEDQRWMAVVGVVPDIKHMGLKNDEGSVVYIPYAQKTQKWLAWTTLLVRTAGEPLEFAPLVRNAIRDLDKNQPVAEISTLEETLARSIAVPRFTTFISSLVSGFALLIAVIGVYGVLTYTLAQRMQELGIRLTLGASPLQVSWLLLRQGMSRVLAGTAIGLLGAWWLAQWLESLLFGVRPHDPETFVEVAGILILASMAAVLAPARRAMNIDPTTALRAE